MTITMLNDIIQKADLVQGENHVELQLRLVNLTKMLVVEEPDSELIEKFLLFINKSALSKVKNVPIRLLINEDEGEENAKMVAIGEFCNDSWLIIFEYGGAQTMTYDKVLEYYEITDAELEVLIGGFV